MTRPISVLVVDDSAFQRNIIARILSQDPQISVVGTASDGAEAIEKAIQLKPDVITLDVEMPHMDGVTALQHIMKEQPTPTIMLSAMTQPGAQTTVQALLRGAVDFVPKPSTDIGIREIAQDLIAKVKVAAQARLYVKPSSQKVKKKQARTTKANGSLGTPGLILPADNKTKDVATFQPGMPLILIGSSTGGPRALQQLLMELPADLEAAVVIVQHMPPGFTLSLSRRLDENSPLKVKEAMPGDSLACGVALLAPGDFHLRFQDGLKVVLDRGPRRNHVRPSVNITMESLVAYHRSSIIGVILTGMGSDGMDGAQAIKDAGGHIIAEHESTCVVYGMPRSVVDAGLSDQVIPLPNIASTLVDMVRSKVQTRI